MGIKHVGDCPAFSISGMWAVACLSANSKIPLLSHEEAPARKGALQLGLLRGWQCFRCRWTFFLAAGCVAVLVSRLTRGSLVLQFRRQGSSIVLGATDARAPSPAIAPTAEEE